jgi:organic radical activating enzyme
MQIKEVHQTWPSDYLRIDISLGDICNFQCWYCWPEAHAAEHKWPDYDLLVKNLSHMLDYYIKHTNKKRFEFCMLGGEVTHWSKFLDFIRYFKERYDCIFNLISNGSKKLSWWKEAAPYLDYVLISHHQKFSKVEHNRDLLDFLYEQGIIGVTTILMDPTEWEGCLETAEYYKKSKRRWSIRYGELIHKDVNYTHEQKAVIANVRARSSNPLWFWRYNKIPRTDTYVTDMHGKRKKVTDNYIRLNRLNEFKGWECDVGVDWLAIKIDGLVKGTCGNMLYNDTEAFNIYDADFTDKFAPIITPTICTQSGCWCGFDTNMPKRKVDFTTKYKVIPIHAN